jgi:hypothetical protein
VFNSSSAEYEHNETQIQLAGPIYMLQVLGQKICVVSSADIAMELLNVRALNYSERPRMPMVRELYVLLHCTVNGTFG